MRQGGNNLPVRAPSGDHFCINVCFKDNSMLADSVVLTWGGENEMRISFLPFDGGGGCK